MNLDDVATFIDQHESAATKWRMFLVRKGRKDTPLPDSDHLTGQRALLRATYESSEALTRNLRQGLKIDRTDLSGFPSLTDPITAAQLNNLQNETALRLYADMIESGCTRRHASTGTYWLLCIIHWLETEKLDNPPAPAFITKNIKTKLLENDYELHGTNGVKHGKEIDDRTRDLLRRLGGLPHIRALTSFWTDCRVAHLWWAAELSEAVSKTEGITFTRDTALKFLLQREIMIETIRWITRRTGRLAQPVALAVVLEAAIGQDSTTTPNNKELHRMMKRLASRSRYSRIDTNSPISVQQLTTLCRP